MYVHMVNPDKMPAFLDKVFISWTIQENLDCWQLSSSVTVLIAIGIGFIGIFVEFIFW